MYAIIYWNKTENSLPIAQRRIFMHSEGNFGAEVFASKAQAQEHLDNAGLDEDLEFRIISLEAIN